MNNSIANNELGLLGADLLRPAILFANGDRRQECDPVAQNRSRSEGARKIERCIHYMLENLNQPLQVSKLAETAHTSPSHFFVLFKRWAGLTPIDFFIRLRMKQACRLLATTSMSVKEVAANLGYDDPFYFSRVFKSVTGASPTDYRLTIEETSPGQNQGQEVTRSGADGLMLGRELGPDLAASSRNGVSMVKKHSVGQAHAEALQSCAVI